MPRFDLDLEDLRNYRPEVREPSDFDSFWEQTLQESRALAGPPKLTKVPTFLTAVDTLDVEFPGFNADPIRGWLTVPHGADGPLPTIVTYNGYGGGRGRPHEHLLWAAAGYAHFFMDTRGQGSGWGNGGDTPDPHGSSPAMSGYMTRGIDDPRDYYFRRLYTDGVLAVDAVRSLPVVDPDRVVVTGYSQGGGIALAVAALAEGLAAATINVPFLSHFERAVGLTEANPYQEIVTYLSVQRDQVESCFTTLSYFDGVNFAKRATTPALFSTALMDDVCPPSTVFASYNHYAATDKAIEVYPFNRHEGGQGHHTEREAAFFAASMA